MVKDDTIKQELLRSSSELGFSLCRITTADPISCDELLRWLDEGRHGSMRYMERNPSARCDPTSLLPGAKSVICCALTYGEGGLCPSESIHPTGDLSRSPSRQHNQSTHSMSGLAVKNPPPRIDSEGRVQPARYARGADYHEVVRDKLELLCSALKKFFPDGRTKCCVDTSPILEKALAQRAGLGWIGKNKLLINPDSGSWFVLGEIITDIDLEPDRPMKNRCGKCTKCLDACPTSALDGEALDARRCISYLTTIHKGPVDPEFANHISDQTYGCDICQEACPYNLGSDPDIQI